MFPLLHWKYFWGKKNLIYSVWKKSVKFWNLEGKETFERRRRKELPRGVGYGILLEHFSDRAGFFCDSLWYLGMLYDSFLLLLQMLLLLLLLFLFHFWCVEYFRDSFFLRIFWLSNRGWNFNVIGCVTSLNGRWTRRRGRKGGGGGGRGGYKLAVECSNFVVTSIVAGQQQQQAKKYRGNSQWRSNIASFVGPSFCCPTWNVSFGFYGRNWNVESGERGSSGVDGGE